MEFARKYKVRTVRESLDDIAREEKYLVDRWILDNEKNPHYRIDYRTERDKYIQRGDAEYYALIDWTLPSTTYKYREIKITEDNFSSYCNTDKKYKLKRSSIIPIVKIGKENYWMLGSFADYEKTGNPILSDFAGSCEKSDLKNICPPISCAFRELHEEVKGLLDEIIQKAMADYKNVACFEGISEKKGEKIFFLFVYLDYNDVKSIPSLFLETDRLDHNKHEKLGPIGFYKQSDVKKYRYRLAKNLTDFIGYLTL
jgi:hypothetical protein